MALAKRRRRRALAAAECSNLTKGTRHVLGGAGGALVGAGTVYSLFYLASAKNRALQKAAGAPAPTPSFFVGLGAAALAIVGGIVGDRLAIRKPECLE